MSQQVLEDAKFFVQEELRRKANQKEALAAMDEEQKRSVSLSMWDIDIHSSESVSHLEAAYT